MNFVVVPVKSLSLGKSRLAVCLSSQARSALSRAMLTDVVISARHAAAVHRVVMVSSDPSLLELARQLGADAVDEGHPRGLNGAAEVGTNFCLQQGATAVLILLADLPLVTPDDVDLLFRQVQSSAQVTVVPCKEGDGTNALLRVPPVVVPTRFGGPSLVAHQQIAGQYGIPCHVIEVPRIAFDLDSVADLHWLAAQQTLTRSAEVLREFGVATRIGS
ncbi:MAG: 2-phospho-L-lactate guanylyltransferase [Candidatus Binatia bacterium]